jgi:ubiquitin carboxyl-terminal hydrolase 7
MEKKMDQTSVKGTYGKLFTGAFQNYIECINVPYNSHRKEEFNCL